MATLLGEEELCDLDTTEVFDVSDIMSSEGDPTLHLLQKLFNVVLRMKATMRSMDLKLGALKKEMDSIRPEIQAFLAKQAEPAEPSQSLLEGSLNSETFVENPPNYFVEVHFNGKHHGVELRESKAFKINGSDCARTRLRLLLEELHEMKDLLNMTPSGKRIDKVTGKTVEGNCVPPVTMELLYQMEVNQRQLVAASADPNVLRILKVEVNGLVGKILEGFKTAARTQSPTSQLEGNRPSKRRKRINDTQFSESSNPVETQYGMQENGGSPVGVSDNQTPAGVNDTQESGSHSESIRLLIEQL